MDWEKMYETGEFAYWDFVAPSSELVATIAVLGLPQPGEVALDIGCGAGREAIFLAQCGYRTIGVDMTAKALEIARERAREEGVPVDFRQGNALDLPIEDESVDFVNDRGCFHLIPEADRSRYASEVLRVMKPGARFLLRGCRDANAVPKAVEERDVHFEPITEDVVQRFFPTEYFVHGPVLPLQLIGNQKALPGNLVVLRKK
ncbi:class I SAM-dependent methyltransferase [Polycladomyces subterraneus]|uniref:Class I SAM-dependent methyltransferase n=1 Tax=Polycladomyces subterraneus TaxID=1016997 RepID=A0ABT8ISJ1_9BACL|nr:class I SAM-dependent methyltransferase [Polycladomyces subterraneus]MDN4595426.1 class I SAM-dependent methyltransferase [Polycladomyces subterraneus]